MGNPTGPKPQDLPNVLPPLLFWRIILYMKVNKNYLVDKKISKKRNTKGKNNLWIIKIILWTIIISGSISFLSNIYLTHVNLILALVLLIIIILIGIIFDIIGIAVASAKEVPFHAMAAKKIPSASIAIKMIKNAEKVSNFCNDVIGDVCGIISGTIGALILAKVSLHFNSVNVTIISAGIGAIIAAATVGGKALGKGIAINNSNDIIDKVSHIVYFFVKDRF